MSRFWSPIVRSLTPYVAGEQSAVQGLAKLNTNENPYGPSPHALAAIRDYRFPVRTNEWTLGAFAALALLAWKPWLDLVARATLIVIAAIVAIGFAWIAGNGWRAHASVKQRRVEPPRVPPLS